MTLGGNGCCCSVFMPVCNPDQLMLRGVYVFECVCERVSECAASPYCRMVVHHASVAGRQRSR